MDKYLVVRKWMVAASDHDDALKKTKQWDHYEVSTKRLTENNMEA